MAKVEESNSLSCTRCDSFEFGVEILVAPPTYHVFCRNCDSSLLKVNGEGLFIATDGEEGSDV